MAVPQSRQNWRYYLVAPRGARQTWFTLVFMGIFFLLAGLVVAVYFYAISWTLSSPGNGPLGGFVIVLVGTILLLGGIYLRRKHPDFGIVRGREETMEGKGPRR